MIALKELSNHLLSVLYEMIFREPMSREAQRFFVGTSYAAIGTLFGALLTLVFNVLGARILGPENFGNLSLIITVSFILTVSMAFGLTATIKYGSRVQDESAQTRVISTSCIQTVLLTAASTGVFVYFSSQLSQLLGLSTELYLFTVLYAVTVTFFTLTMNSLRTLLRMKAYGLLNAAQSAILLLVFLAFIGNNLRSWQSAAYSLDISCAAVSLILFAYLRNYIKLQFDKLWSKKIMKYSFFAIPGVIATAFMGVDRILINKFTTTADVGIYSAYSLPSITVAVLLWGIFNASFFPYASRSNDRQAIFRKINRAAPYFAVLFVPLIILSEVTAFFFYGQQYPFSLEISFLFAAAATSFAVFQCYTWLIASTGTDGAKVITLSNILAFVVLVGLNVALIPLIGITGAAITLIFAYLIPSIFLFSKRGILNRSYEKSYEPSGEY